MAVVTALLLTATIFGAEAVYDAATDENRAAMIEQLKEAIRTKNGHMVADLYRHSFVRACKPEIKDEAHDLIKTMKDHTAVLALIERLRLTNHYALNDLGSAIYQGTVYEARIRKILQPDKPERVYPSLQEPDDGGSASRVHDRLAKDHKEHKEPARDSAGGDDLSGLIGSLISLLVG